MGSKWGSFKSVWPTLVAGPVVVSVVVVFLAGSASAVVSAREDLVARTGPWTLEGKADLHDSGALDLRIRSIAGVSPAFDLVRRLLIGRDVLLVNTRVPIVDTRGRSVALSRLNDAILRVKGTLMSPGQWLYDLDGEATPTVRVSRIVVLSLDPD